MKMIQAALLALAAMPQAAAADPCRTESFEDQRYTLCSFDMRKDDLRMFWKDEGGKPYRTFSRLAEALDARGMTLGFAMNGGMYRETFAPVGLYVEGGRELSPANTASVDISPVPNFYKKPNGVFFIAAATAGVVTTESYLADRPKADFATQSGPMLVIAGRIHPAFIVGSTDRQPRNGVGVSNNHRVHFAISEGPVNFHDFARFFQDGLDCANALFLDGGSAPGLYDRASGRSDGPGHGGYGPIVGAVGEKP